MFRSTLLLGFLFVAPSAFGQTPSADSQTLQALLAEVRQLRQELQTNGTAAQRTQLLFFRLQTQETTVARLSQRAEDARMKLAETQTNRKNLDAEAKRAQDTLERADNALERKSLEDTLRFFKLRSETLAEEEQLRQAKQIELEDQLRLEQAKLNELLTQLDELDKTLQKTRLRPADSPR